MKLLRITFILFLIIIIGKIYSQNVFINEIMSNNESVIQDEDGDYSDWIEIYNNGTTTINLCGCYITDDSLMITKWCFPECQLEPDSFLLLFASGKDKTMGPYLHTNFKIDSDGEAIILSNPIGELIDYIGNTPIGENISYGRKSDAGPQWIYFDSPTPQISNNNSNSLHFSKPRGFYVTPFKLFIQSDDYESAIYFTLDGSNPSPNSILFSDSILINYRYNEPNVISEIQTTPDSAFTDNDFWVPPAGPVEKATVLRARSFKNGFPNSKIYSQTYFIDSTIFTRFPYPVISLITDPSNLFNYDTGIYVPGSSWNQDDPWWTGNYYQKSDEWERDIHIEYFSQQGEVEFYQDAGVRIHGKLDRRKPQKTLRFYAEKEYGKQHFYYPLLPQRQHSGYKRFLLKNSFGCINGTIIKDAMTNDLIRPLGIDNMEYRPVIVFLDGEYWGFQTIRDYQDANYLSYLHDIDEDSLDLLENGGYTLSGTNEDYIDLISFIENNDISLSTNYIYVGSKMDISNYIDYQIIEIFLRNYDWPGSNIKFWRSDEFDGLWRWIFFDIDFGYGDYNYNMLEHCTLEGGTEWPNPDWSTFLFRNLLKNETFKTLFINRFAELMNTTLQSDTIISKIEDFTALYDPEINQHIYRWGYPSSKSDWLDRINYYLIKFAENRPCIMRDHMMEFFELEEFAFDCNNLVLENRDSIKIYPNPNDGIFTISSNRDEFEAVNVTVINTLGVQVYSEKNDDFAANNRINFNLTSLSDGIYFLIFKSETRNLSFVRKIVIKK